MRARARDLMLEDSTGNLLEPAQESSPKSRTGGLQVEENLAMVRFSRRGLKTP